MRNISVNALDRGPTVPEGMDTMGIGDPENGFEKMFIAATLLSRPRQPDDIAKAAVFLASDDSGWITGELVYAAGGHFCVWATPTAWTSASTCFNDSHLVQKAFNAYL